MGVANWFKKTPVEVAKKCGYVTSDGKYFEAEGRAIEHETRHQEEIYNQKVQQTFSKLYSEFYRKLMEDIPQQRVWEARYTSYLREEDYKRAVKGLIRNLANEPEAFQFLAENVDKIRN